MNAPTKHIVSARQPLNPQGNSTKNGQRKSHGEMTTHAREKKESLIFASCCVIDHYK
jgi:hypothetical protein